MEQEFQLPEYAKVENIKNLIYAVFDNVEDSEDNTKKLNKMDTIVSASPYKV